MTPHGAKGERNDDPILESCLEEILGGQSPPDLTAQILARWKEADQDPTVAPPPFQVGPAAPPVQSRQLNGARRDRCESRRRDRGWRIPITLSGCLAIILIGVFYQFAPWGFSHQAVVRPSRPQDSPRSRPHTSSRLAEAAKLANQRESTPVRDSQPEVSPEPQDKDANTGDAKGTRDDATVPPETPRAEKLSDQQMVASINARIRAQWEKANVQESGAIDDEFWQWRVFWGLFDRGVNKDERRAFERMPEPNKREVLVKQLFSDERYKREYAKNWAGYWSSRLLSRAGDSHDAKLQREGLARHLEARLEEDTPHNQLVAELITAEGSNSLREPDVNEATNFPAALWKENATQLSSEVCRVLLGQRIQCAQCHNDTTVSGTSRETFWQMTAFFSQMNFETLPLGKVRLTDREIADQVTYQDADGHWKTVEPKFIDGTRIESAGKPLDRRRELARFVTESDQFAKAAVNRIWAHFLGFGFTTPIDDMGSRNKVSHPELLDLLAKQFQMHGYDTQRLIRWIVMSEAFDRANGIQSSDTPEIGSVPYFSRHYGRSGSFSTAEQAIAGLSDGQANELAQELELYARIDIQELDKEGKPKPPRGTKSKKVDLGEQLTKHQQSVAKTIHRSKKMSEDQKLQHVFLNILDRFPTESELERARKTYRSAKNEKKKLKAIENLIWALSRTQQYADEHQ